jgi:hypothetical protein
MCKKCRRLVLEAEEEVLHIVVMGKVIAGTYHKLPARLEPICLGFL